MRGRAVLRLEVACRRGAKLFAKHGNEGADAVVAGIECCAGHFFPRSEALQRVKQAQLLTPLAERHFYFCRKDSLDGALAGAARARERSQRPRVRRIRKQDFDDADSPRIGKTGQLERNGMSGFELVDEECDDTALAQIATVQLLETACMKDKLLEQGRDVDNGALSRESPNQPGKEVERTHRNLAGHGHGMRSVGGNPHSAKGRDNPGALRGAKGHDPTRSKNQLVFRMKMFGDEMAVSEVPGNAGHVGMRLAAAIEKDAVTLFRHSLSQ